IEFQGFNIPLSEARERTDEAIDIMRLAWTKDHFSYKGKWTQFENLNVLPKPIQKPHPPIWTASVSPETIGHYAKKGIPFITDPLATFGRCKRASDEWKRLAAENGHDVSDPNFGTLRGLVIGETHKEAWDIAEKAHMSQRDTNLINLQSAPIEKTGEFAAGYYFWKDRYLGKNQELTTEFFWERMWLAGTPDRIVQTVKNLEEMGFRHILFTLGHAPQVSMEENKRRLKLFAEGVMPHFKKKAQPQVVAKAKK
ncbi:MAG: LLM class flavin-dependent oxidoreductase, partial [Chloroflexi bacterium]|nr:LLM class flavin-dependent oxidoreductase [Chloroflexota bacterium]